MNKRLLTSLLVVIVLVVLFARELRHWESFGWDVFWQQRRQIRIPYALAGMAMFYLAYFVRAWRWKLFLKPVRETTTARILGPTFVGFTGLALLGRPGEFVRPYLIARKEGLTVPSQIAVWAVERIFDLGAFTVLVIVAVFFADVRGVPHLEQFRRVSLIMMGLVAVIAAVLVQLERHGTHVETKVQRWLKPIWPRFADVAGEKIRHFGEGLNTITDRRSFLVLALVSIATWTIIAFGYALILRSFPPPLRDWALPNVPLLIGFSILGGLLQLPAGATSQLMVIAALMNVFHVPGALAVSAGIVLWLGGYMSPIPIGIAYLRHEHLSLRAITRESRGGDGQSREAELSTAGKTS